ncbi:MAG TPA: hypothetical protein VFP49_10915 [Nitrososphaeraceae archaeon]|nr:hypothetical protein [Nitrososphaeraceae archaeon]
MCTHQQKQEGRLWVMDGTLAFSYFPTYYKSQKILHLSSNVSPSIWIKPRNLESIAGYCLFTSFDLRAKTNF